MRYTGALWVAVVTSIASATDNHHHESTDLGPQQSSSAYEEIQAPKGLTTTIHSTIYETTTVCITVTESDISTVISHTTNYATKTATSTFETSPPVTVTSVKNCIPRRGGNDAYPTPPPYGASPGDDQFCDTITTTEWRTTTTTSATTVIETTVTTKTVPITFENTKTLTQTETATTTVHVTDKYTATEPFSTQYPVVTEVTKIVTATTTVTAPAEVTTNTVKVPGPIETQTLPAETKTLPEKTVTLPGPTLTEELPGTTVIKTKDGVTYTVSLPKETTTLPASTVVSTITQVLPAETVTMTRDGTTLTSTLPAETVVSSFTTELSGTTVTLTADGTILTTTLYGTATVTAPGRPTTVSLPGQTITRPGSTIISTITKILPGETTTVVSGGTTLKTTLPGEIVTVTRNGETVTTTLPKETVTIIQGGTTLTSRFPGTTQIITSTAVLTLHSPTIAPTQTVTTTLREISVCPSPTGNYVPLLPDSDLTFGCKPGYVCSPPKPNGCNVWPEPPSQDFLCRPEDCIASPPLRNVTWSKNETSYYPLTEGLFNLDPEAFGLSYDIFSYQVYDVVENGHTRKITTGNWGSQSSLTDYPRTASTAMTTSRGYPVRSPYIRRALHVLSKRDVIPSICFNECNGALNVAETTGKTDDLCDEQRSFKRSYEMCDACRVDNKDSTKDTIRDYPKIHFAQYLEFCSGRKPKAAASTPGLRESIVTALPTLQTSEQADTSKTGFFPITASTEELPVQTTATVESGVSMTFSGSSGAAQTGPTATSDAEEATATWTAEPTDSQSAPVSSGASPGLSSNVGSSNVQTEATTTSSKYSLTRSSDAVVTATSSTSPSSSTGGDSSRSASSPDYSRPANPVKGSETGISEGSKTRTGNVAGSSPSGLPDSSDSSPHLPPFKTSASSILGTAPASGTVSGTVSGTGTSGSSTSPASSQPAIVNAAVGMLDSRGAHKIAAVSILAVLFL